MRGDILGYKRQMEFCKTSGSEVVESDRSAARAAKSGEVPVVELLKARLLFDGGYFQRAYDLLKSKQASGYFAIQNQLEFTYRMGRITHRLGRYDEALRYYQATIDKGANKPWYFACRAALERGHIFEEQGNARAARSAFERCLKIDPEDYKSGLHQKAKAGLRRLK
jgi:tetratricopeptide (TPR) repeat protein